MKEHRVLAFVQARTGSSRFPGKVLEDIEGWPLIGWVLNRLAMASSLESVTLVTSKESTDDELCGVVESLGFPVFRGSELDVLDRYYRAALETSAETVVRITGDCPLIDPKIVDSVVGLHLKSGADYSCNIAPPTFPDGLDTEVFSFSALKVAWKNATRLYDREHVTSFMRESGRFHTENYSCDFDYSGSRWTVDEKPDLDVVRSVCAHFRPQRHFAWTEVRELEVSEPWLFVRNRGAERNAGSAVGSGQKTWRRAKQVIPGGGMLLSKRPEMFLPGKWPAYYSKARGCHVWDLDGNRFLDVSLMGIGTNLLGYGNPEVDAAVKKAVEAGNMSTLNCPEEVLLAEKLCDMHPFAEMVRLARTGGEANAIAIRIARAASGRDTVAFCGYHGWHDWYISANLSDDAGLDGHLLPGLDPRGVPRALKDTALPFQYNRLDQLEAIVQNNNVGVIKMEVSRDSGPAPGFLEGVRRLADRIGAVLVFDECTSGFRAEFGGLHKLYGVEPDLAIFGKTLGNGYAITSVVGRREVMEVAQSTFISSTFWTERIGPSAALATLRVMERDRSWQYVTDLGIWLQDQWRQLAASHGIPLVVTGIPALSSFRVDSVNWLQYKTLISQELLKSGMLATNAIYVCTQHTRDLLQPYLEALGRVFAMIKLCEDGREIGELLETDVCHSGFRRLT
ncbi:MAG: aminotransferase class III-fold pyridoxal phosphate-dependent enzyme [Rhodothermales bacterium]|nr:aminotransferase class III-fold pyridoxal phosphate-dependent enzyme [Rhodothermales bacterium]MBO6781017.1 aminotransferase class III-fold pyridoxal phosphate-dependent enzyme [Rhodothermales bacterium]